MRRPLVGALLALAACRSAPPPDVAYDPPSGFDAAGPARRARPGDRMLFRLSPAGGEAVLVEIEALPVVAEPQEGVEFEIARVMTLTFADGTQESVVTSMTRVEVRVWTEAGELLERTFQAVPETFLEGGLARGYASLESALASADTADDKDAQRDMGRGILHVLGLFQVVTGNAALRPLLWRVVDRPPVWRALLGVDVTLSVGEEAERRTLSLPAPVGALDGWVVSVDLDVNGTHALRGRLEVVEPVAPFLLTGGILAVEGEHPREPGRSFRIELVAAREGAQKPGRSE